jgi:predicted membrane protein (TIGR00267 family)
MPLGEPDPRQRLERTSSPRRPSAWQSRQVPARRRAHGGDPRRALGSAVTIAVAYIVGGFIPLGPYITLKATMALPASVGITLLALAIFGYVKGHFTGAAPLRSSLQTVVIGGLAAAAAFLIARAIA